MKQTKNQIATTACCPSCKHKIHSTLEEMKKKPQFACPSCGGNCDVREAIAWVETRVTRTWLKRVA